MDRRLIATTLLALALLGLNAQQVDYRLPFKAMGSAFEVVVVAHKDSTAWATEKLERAKGEIERIEKLISSWDPNSETSTLNASAGAGPIKISAELNQLIWRSVGIYDLTDGAFDITYASMASIWNFDEAERLNWPDSALVDTMQQLVNAQKIEFFYNNEIALPKKGMRIGFGGIGKGYAADKAAKLLRAQGVQNGVINASGDIYAWGKDENGEAWRVAVVNPKNKNQVRLWLDCTNQAIVTSGDYEKYKMRNGIRYAHIINPRTGYPVTGIWSTTVVAPSAELADALATAIFVLGREKGLELIDGFNGVECIIIDSNDQTWFSKNIAPQTN